MTNSGISQELKILSAKTSSRFASVLGLAALAFLNVSPVRADSPIDFAISGFGTLAYTISDNDDVSFHRGLGATGADSSGTLKTDSRLGIQADVGFNEYFSATAQGVLRQNSYGDVRLQAEWAYLRAQVNDNNAVRIGRMTDPIFMYSDVREVGYAHPSIRLPEDIYSQSPIANFDGIDLINYLELNDTIVSTRIYYGKKKFNLPYSFYVDAKSVRGISFDIDHGIAQWRLGFTRTSIDFGAPYKSDIAAALYELSQVYPEFEPLAIDLQPGKYWLVDFINLGVRLDLAPWELTGEWLQLDSNAYASDTQSWRLTLARTFNTITPYITLSALSQKQHVDIPDLEVPALEQLVTATQAIFAPLDQQSVILGMRWDFAPQINFKAQLQHVERDDMGQNFVQNDPLAPANTDDVQLLTVGFDFIF